MYRKTFAEINLNHLKHNLEIINHHFSGRYICPMVKANAYGHGDIVIAKYLEKLGVKQVGVCLIEEGILLRQQDIKMKILVFRGFDKEGAQAIIENQLTPVVSNWDQLENINKFAKGQFSIQIKFNTGMNRLGFEIEDASRIVEFLSKHNHIKLEAILTHLHQGEDAQLANSESHHQLNKFEQAIAEFHSIPCVIHALNSSGGINLIKVRDDKSHYLNRHNYGVRPGLMLYGYNTVNRQDNLGLKRVMSLKSIIADIRVVKKGDGVSYNATWRAGEDSLIAIVPIGYADGFHRLNSNRSSAIVCGQLAPIVGNICMDFLMIDVTSVAKKIEVVKDSEVILFGDSQNGLITSAYEVADHTQTIPWEVLTSVGERVPRIYKG